MPRQGRVVVPDLPLHIVHRGNNRLACFRNDSDYLVYLALLQDASRRVGCAVHAYCLMTNHVHVLATPATERASGAMMHSVAQRYAHYFNRSGGRTGALWEGRFRSCIVESAGYILACYRYIELNPVRAGMVSRPEAYPWSSFACNSGDRVDPFITPHAEFLAIRRADYKAMVTAGVESKLLAEIRESTNGGYPLASASFKSKLQEVPGRRLSPGRPGRPRKSDGEEESVNVPDLFSEGGVS